MATFKVTENYGTYQGDTSYIIDGKTNNVWRADKTNSAGQYVLVEASETINVNSVTYSTTQSSEVFKSGTWLQISSDGSSWTDVGQFNGSTSQTFNVNAQCKYLRIYCKSGSGYVSISELAIDYTDIGGGGGSGDEVEGEIKVFEYTGAVQQVTLPAGRYKLECWGAQGGTYQSYIGGKGGYSVGILTLTEPTTLYIQVGGQPAPNSTSRATTEGGYNGGGKGQNRYYSSTYTYGQGGGGGTDIRIGQDSLYARVIVAGGGGGSASDNSSTKWGGGETGGNGGSTVGSAFVAKQTAPSTSGRYVAGTFGQGANAYSSRTDYQCGSGGGGGGWYGGYAYNYAQDSQTALRGYNGGGSGYVYNADNAKNYPSGCLLTSKYYLEDAATYGGNTDEGKEGHGKVRITDLTPRKKAVLHVKQNNSWQSVSKVWRKENDTWVEVTDIQALFANAESGTNSGYFIDV